jgi:hypothetical protein
MRESVNPISRRNDIHDASDSELAQVLAAG